MAARSNQHDHAVRQATRWTLATQLASQLFTIGTLAVLCRLVDPDRFGIFSTALLIVALPRTFATAGFSAAIVQRDRLTSEQSTMIWWLGLAVGAACAVAATGAGFALAAWRGAEQLGPLTAALSATSVIAALGIVHQGLLERKLAFPTLQRIRLVAQASAGAVAIALAWRGAQAWALVAQQFVELAVLSLGCWWREPWRPGWPRRQVGAASLVRFGGYFSLANLAFYIGQNADKLLLYAALGATSEGAAALGMYTLAFNLMMRPVYAVTTPLTSVMFPALARVANDASAFRELVCRFFRMNGILLLPAGAGLWLVAPDAALLLAGDDWTQTGSLLRALAPVILVQGFINVCGTILSSASRLRPLLIGACVFSAVLMQAYGAGYWLGAQFGESPADPTLGVALGYSLASVVVLGVPYLIFCLAVVGVRARDALLPLVRPLTATAGMSVAVWFVQRTELAAPTAPLLQRLTLQIAVGVAIYAWLARHDLRWFRDSA